MKSKGLIHIYAGSGKGKTTAALGLILRAKGAGKKACLIQFLKAKASSELSALKKLEVRVVAFKEKHPMFYKSASIKKLKAKISKDIKKTAGIIKRNSYDLIVLDEALYLISKGLIKESEIINLIILKPHATELVLTGGSVSKRMLRLADYISTIKNTKHPYEKGILPRKGIEY